MNMIHRNLVLLALVIYRTVGVNVEKLRGKYMKSDKADYYQITVPRKVSEDGEFVTHYLPHFYDTSRSKRHLQGEYVNYLITIDNKDHHVQLWPTMDFIAPGLVVEHHAENVKDNVSNIVIRQIRSNRCYFNGIIRGEPYSRAILSTCDGLSGIIKTATEHYLIEPVHEDDQPMMDDKQLHLIYKRSFMESLFNHTNCGTKGTFKEAMNDRLRWENIYGVAVENSIRNPIYDHLLYTKGTKRQLDYIPETNRKIRKCMVCLDTTTPLCSCPPTDPMCLAKTPLYLEMMLTIDFRIDRAWAGVDVETYILSIMNMVASNLADGSIGNPIKLNIVRMILLTYAYPQLDILRYSPMKLLKNYCQWQMNFNPNNEYHPNHHDFAVFVTRFEPCQGHILGVTNMASICRPDKSCAVVSDEGLLLANIITHQIGHSLGADHDDGSSGGCAPEEPDGTIYHMGPVMTMSSSEWSVCSKHCITDFVSTRIGWCLADMPSYHDFSKPNILPGQIYSPIQQCSINFNMKTMACRIGEFCKMLYCQISPTQCASTGDPPAAGTPCAMNMWCFHGDCVQRGARPGAVNGEWGPWSHWSQCSRSCGGGVQIRHRSCNDPAPLHGGRYCKGDFISFKMCSILPCMGFSQGFAQLQCKLTDNRPYKGVEHTWDHFQSFFEDVECALICINERKQIALRSPVVVDGTPCKEGARDVCVQGKCMKVGCDWVINSKSKEDACGVCHGNGTECRIVQGYFIEVNITGELHPFLKLPTGTSMIFIREINPSNCIIVVTSSVNSTFYLNNLRGEETLPGLVNIAGTLGVYETRANMERLYVQGSIRGPITVNLFCKDHIARAVRYQYALPESDEFYLPRYNWEYVYWEKCDVPCGGGAQRAQVVCVEARSGEVDDKYCSSITKPDDIIRACNQFPCTARWWVGPWSDCDCTDGEGIQTRLVLCLRMHGMDTSKSKVVKERECCRQPKPRIERPCSPAVEFQLGETTQVLRGKRQMRGMLPYVGIEENLMTEPVVNFRQDFMSATHFPLIAHIKSYENEFRAPEISVNKAREENRLIRGKEYDEALEPLSKAFNRNIGENIERRHKKLFPNARTRLRPNLQELALNQLISSPYNQHRSMHRPRLYNALIDMANKLDKENGGLDRIVGKKEGGLIPFHEVKGGTARLPQQVLSKMSNKLIRPSFRGHQDSPTTLANNTLLVLRPVSEEMPVKIECTVPPATQRTATNMTTIRTTTECITFTTKHSSATTIRSTTQNTSWCPLRQLTKAPLEKSTTCGLHRATGYEPADLPGWLETANTSSYKLILAPIEPVQCGFKETDDEFQVLGRSGSWPVGDVRNQVAIFGEQVLEALLEGKRRMTKPPIIETD